MKFTSLKENLKNGLSAVERIVSKNVTLPILNNILLKTEKNFLCLISTNLELGIQYWVMSKVDKEGAVVVPTKLFSSFVSAINDEKISVESSNNTVKIKNDDYKAQIKGFDSQEFPLIPEIDNQEVITVDGATFASALSQIMNFCSNNQIRPELAGIYLLFQKDTINMVATDSFRLAEKKVVLKSKLDKEYSFIIPQKTAQEIVNIFTEENELNIFFSKNQILFESKYKEVDHPKVRLTSTLIQGQFPNYKEIIPKGKETTITLDSGEMTSKLKMSGLFTNKTNEVKLTVDSKKGIVNISAQNTDTGENESFIKADVSGINQEVCFNNKFLLDGLGSVDSKKITFEVNGENGPSVLRGVGDDSYLYLVMPIRNN